MINSIRDMRTGLAYKYTYTEANTLLPEIKLNMQHMVKMKWK